MVTLSTLSMTIIGVGALLESAAARVAPSGVTEMSVSPSRAPLMSTSLGYVPGQTLTVSFAWEAVTAFWTVL